MHILLVSPRHEDLLHVDDEVQDIINSGNQVTPLIGNVTHPTLLRATYRDKFDVLWFCSHGDESSILLSDGPLTVQLLAGLVKGKFGLVVINTCKSRSVAEHLVKNAGCSVICTVSRVDDKEAYQTGALFARNLAKYNFKEAYNRVRLEVSNYVLVEGVGGATMDESRLSLSVDKLSDQINKMEQRLILLEYQIKQLQSDLGVTRPLNFNHVTALVISFAIISILTALYISGRI